MTTTIPSKLSPDFHQPSKRDRIELSTLTPFQRILITTDGTLTKILEAYLLEEIQMVKLSERSLITTHAIPQLDIDRGSEVIKRKILLQGKSSRKTFVYAETILVPERLTQHFQKELIESETPLGKLVLKHRIATFKELLDSSKEPSGELSSFFEVNNQDYLLSRTYCLFFNYRPIMMITEKFPESYFTSKWIY